MKRLPRAFPCPSHPSHLQYNCASAYTQFTAQESHSLVTAVHGHGHGHGPRERPRRVHTRTHTHTYTHARTTHMHASITHSAYVPRSLINHLDTHTVVVVITPGVDLYGAQHALQRSPPHNGHMPHSVRAAGSTSTGARTALSVHTCARWPACDSAVAGVTACWATPHSVQHVASIRGAPLIPSAVC